MSVLRGIRLNTKCSSVSSTFRSINHHTYLQLLPPAAFSPVVHGTLRRSDPVLKFKAEMVSSALILQNTHVPPDIGGH